jgi:arabinose-5-phosphate isomerase
LVGVITDGDLRRRLEQSKNPLEDKAKDLMRTQPKVVEQDSLAEKALRLFEQHAIQSLFVVDKMKGTELKPVGLLHLHDLLKSGIR